MKRSARWRQKATSFIYSFNALLLMYLLLLLQCRTEKCLLVMKVIKFWAYRACCSRAASCMIWCCFLSTVGEVSLCTVCICPYGGGPSQLTGVWVIQLFWRAGSCTQQCIIAVRKISGPFRPHEIRAVRLTISGDIYACRLVNSRQSTQFFMTVQLQKASTSRSVRSCQLITKATTPAAVPPYYLHEESELLICTAECHH